jgi:Mce-associated membrane protein
MSVLSDSARRDDVATAPASPGADPGTEPGGPADVRRPQRRRTLLAAALALVAVVCVALMAWMSFGGRSSGADGALSLPEEREQVMGLTSQFVKRLGTYSPDMLDDSGQMPAYREQVREVITPKFAADFDQEVATAEQLVAQGGITRSADVFATAVSSIDDDSARVLVAGAFTDSYRQGEGDEARVVDQEPLPFRFTVDLVVIEGEWLVDDFSPVSSDEGQGQAPGTAPAPGEGSTP